MEHSHRRRSGFFIVSAWTQLDDPLRLRARVTRTVDVQRGKDVATIEEAPTAIEKALHDWLEDFLEAPPR